MYLCLHSLPLFSLSLSLSLSLLLIRFDEFFCLCLSVSLSVSSPLALTLVLARSLFLCLYSQFIFQLSQATALSMSQQVKRVFQRGNPLPVFHPRNEYSFFSFLLFFFQVLKGFSLPIILFLFICSSYEICSSGIFSLH